MATQRYYDDVLASLVERVNYIERRVSNSETADTSFGLTHAGLAGLGADDHTQYHNDTRGDIRYYTKAQAVAYTGTPTASTFAVWTAAGTLAGTTLNTSSFVISQGVLGGQQVAGDTAISGSLHIYGTNYSAGTGNPNFTAIYFAPSKGLTPTLATRMDHDGDWTFTRNILVQGTLSAEDTDITHAQLAGLTTGDPHTQYLLLAGRSGGQTVYAGPGTADNLTFFASNGDSGDGADIAFDFWSGNDPSDKNTLTMYHNGRTYIRHETGVNVTPSTTAQLDVVSGDAGRHALRLKAAASPTADIIDVEDSGGTTLLAVTKEGWLTLPGGSGLKAARASIAASTILDFTDVINTTANGMLFVSNKSNAIGGIVHVRGGFNSVTAVAVTTGISVTKDTANSINIYYDSGYKIQNTYTSTRSVDFYLV